MKRFSFNLASLGRLREHKLDLAQEQFRIATEKRKQAAVNVTEADQRLSNTLQAQAEGARQHGLKPELAAGTFRYVQELEKQLQQLRIALRTATTEEQAAYQKLLKCRQDAKVIERLYEKAREAHTLEMHREEEREATDFHNSCLVRAGRRCL